jgi:hypothetical protein
LLSAARLLIGGFKYGISLFRGENRLSWKPYLWLFEDNQVSVVDFSEKLKLHLSSVGISRREFCGRSRQLKES